MDLINDKLTRWWEYLVAMSPNFMLALLIIIVFALIARLVRTLSGKFILRISKSASLSGLLSGVLYLLVMAAGVMTSLDILGFTKAVSSLLAGVGIIGLALGFAFQDLTSNFISGAFIALRRPFEVGHIVETNGFTGTIEDIQLRSTTIRTYAGLHVMIPNKDIFQKPIINYSRTDRRRVEFEFLIPNTVDVSYTGKILRQAAEKIGSKNAVQKLEFYYTAIENPNMRINVSFWTTFTEPREFMRIRHKAIMAIFQSFANNKIYKIQIPEAPEQKETTEQLSQNTPEARPPGNRRERT